jgi:hypothetical protein
MPTSALFLDAVAIAVMATVSLLLLFTADNKRKVIKPPSQGHRSWRSVTKRAVPAMADPLRAATMAIESAGGRDLTIGDRYVAGWVGNWWTNIGRYAQYQIVVEVVEETDPQTTFICACRPRFRSQWTGSKQMSRLTSALATALTSTRNI